VQILSPSARRIRRLLLAALLLVVILPVAACFDPLDRAGSRDPNPNHIVVGSGTFPESQIIGQIYIDALRANGFKVSDRLNSGTRERYIPALRAGDIDLVPDYVGNLLQYLAKSAKGIDAQRADALQSLTVLPAIEAALPQVLGADLVTYSPAPGSNSDSVTVSRETADRHHLVTIDDLARLSQTQTVTFMANSEFATRPVGLPGLLENYGLKVDFRPNNDSGGPATQKALLSGNVTAADIYTTTPLLLQTDKVAVLDDPRGNFPANNVVPVLAREKNSPRLRTVLDAVSAKLTLQQLQSLNDMVSGSRKIEIEDAAKDWVRAQGLNRRIG